MKPKTLLLPVVFLGLLGIFLFIKKISQNSYSQDHPVSVGQKESSSNASLDADISEYSPSKRDRPDAAYIKSRQEMDREFDKILPATFPDHNSSLCDTNLKLGDHLILGGFETKDGNFVFNSLNVQAIEVDGKTKHIAKMTMFTMSPENVNKLGLDSLLSPAKKRIQQSIVFPAENPPWMDSPINMAWVPPITLDPGQRGSIETIKGQEGVVMSMISEPGSDENFTRIRTRLEIPVEKKNL